jgi:hypothetical protein
MNVYATRDSVCAGDDADAPHPLAMTVPAEPSLEAIIVELLRTGYLPSISGGCATWVACSGVPIAVIAQQWGSPKMLLLTGEDELRLDRNDGDPRIHFSYFAQRDLEEIFEIVRRLRLRAV